MRLKGRLGLSALPLLINSNDLRTTERNPDTLLLCEPGQFRQAFDERFIQCHSTVSVCVLREGCGLSRVKATVYFYFL